jgi:gliding motility-associated-like protein
MLLGGNFQTTSGIYTDTLVSSLGCDSILITNLIVSSELFGDTIILRTCDSAVWQGITYTNSGIYNDTISSSSGCDSILVLDLTITNPYIVNTNQIICYGDSSFLNGSYQDTSGLYIDTLVSEFGCDSIVLTSLIVLNENIGDTTMLTACDSTIWNGNVYSISGIFTDTLQSTAGCDSIATLDLTINSTYFDDTTSLIGCDSVSWNGVFYYQSGIYNDTLQRVTGCDSILTLDLIINQSTMTNNFVQICSGDSILVGGSYQLSGGVYFDTLQTAAGCDSITSTTLTVTTFYTVPLNSQICNNDSILFGGNYLDTSGIYYDTVQNSNGCDTLFVLDLVVDSAIPNTLININACDEFLTPNGILITSSGVFNDTLVAVSGCDSIINYNVTITYSSFVTVTDTACGSYLSPQGNIYTATGIYTDTLVNSIGCDSIITIDLLIFCNDTDGDGIPDDIDQDDDNDGISDVDEGTGDTDGDGIPDYLDVDSDNDGIFDVVESGNGLLDTNNDGVIDSNDTGFSDNNNNGMADGSENTSPIDSDKDGIADYLDLDSDNDGIYDVIEGGDGSQDTNNDGVVDSNDNGFTDTDNNGMSDNTQGTSPLDNDSDGVLDYLDLDSDNDGIYDVVESGNGSQDTNNDGVIDLLDSGYSDTDNNGMSDVSQGSLPTDTDSDGTADYLDLDSDGDGCSDVIEAGFVDGDGDGYLGDSPTSQDSLGLVVNSGGYLIPVDLDSTGIYDFLEEGSQVVIDINPSELEVFSEGDDIILTTESNSLSTIFYQWQISSDGGASWDNVIDNNIFSGAQTNTLYMYGLTKEFDQHLLQLVVSTPGYACGSDEISEQTLLQLETVLIPEGFSPNGDNVNDTWHISGIDQYPINHVEVYSRWETKVFETDNYGTNNEWNGIPNVLNGLILGNSNVPEGTYFYIITFGGEYEGKKPIKGFVYIRNK